MAEVAWLLDGHRAVVELRTAVLPHPQTVAPGVAVAAELAPLGGSAPEPLVALDGMRRYHRPGCPLLAGKATTTAASRSGHERAGRRPCGVCEP
jgi:hypothetical protein